MTTRERRAAGAVEKRAEGESILTGYAAVFNARTTIAGYFEEEIAPGAFVEAIRRDDVRALIDHDPTKILGRNTAGTLRLSEDDRGLRFEVDLPETSLAADLRTSMKRGDINQASFAFAVKREEWSDRGDKALPLRRILEVGPLFDVSVVTYPAYEQTEAALRSLDQFRSRKAAGKTAGFYRRLMRLGLAQRA